MNKIVRNLIFIVFFLLSRALSMAQTADLIKEKADSYQLKIKNKPTSVADFSVTSEAFCFENDNISITVTALDAQGNVDTKVQGNATFRIDHKNNVLSFHKGVAIIQVSSKNNDITIENVKTGVEKEASFRVIYGWTTILPPLIAILFALITRQVLLSLFLGIFSGCLILYGFQISSFFLVIERYGMKALNDSGHLSIIVFSTIIGGMVAVISRNGGMAGVVDVLSKYARSARSSQLVTWILGIAIFFDDYANTLVVGNTMKSVTDKHGVSREKLAYIVDSTAAPVASIAFITTWIGAELGYIDDATASLGIDEGAYSIFLGSLKYAYYPIFTLVFMFFIIWFQKDFGPMKKAEDLARKAGAQGTDHALAKDEEFEPINPDKTRWYNAALPVLTLIVVVFVGLYITGTEATGAEDLEGLSVLRQLGVIIGNSDSYASLLWASLLAISIAILLTVSQKIMSLEQTMGSVITGFNSMTTAMIILISAWALAAITEDLHTADYLSQLFTGNISTGWIPTITFVLAGAVAFSTGSSWGTMAILYPLILPATWSICGAAGLEGPEAMEIMYHVTAVVLAGSVFGDHCSPISDTTILSSLASGCNHIEHVRTQLPYAALTGVVSIFISLVIINLGIPWYISYLIGIGILFAIVKIFGK